MDIDVRGLMAIGLAEWRKVRLKAGYFLTPEVWFTPNTLPVVGIDAVVAQDILFALHAVDHEGRGVADAWLRAVQCAQLAHDRLLRDLHDAERNLTFWQRQVSAGGVWSHGAFMLLSRGPLSFAEDVAGAARSLASRGLAALQQQGQAQRQGQRQQLTAPGGSHPGASPVAALASSAATSAATSASATDMMQQRVLLLRGLRLRLAQALAELTRAAGSLRVGDLLAAVAPGESPPQPAAAAARSAGESLPAQVGFAAAAAAVAEGRMPSFSAARQAQEQEGMMAAIEEAVRIAVRGMRAALEGLMSYAGGSGDSDTAASHSRHQQQQQQPAPGSPERSLSLELRELLDLLALQPPAATALGVVAPEPQRPSVAAAETPAGAGAGAGTPHSLAGAAQGDQQATGDDADGGGAGDGPTGLQLASGGCSAAAALGAARRAAALAGPLVPLPSTARMPSRFQRHWLRYCAIGGLLLYGGAYLVRHSRLAGSDDLDRWILTAVSAVRSALRTHVAEPLAAVRDELFRTFRDRPAIVSAEDFSLSRESLLRMLAAFAADHRAPPAAATTGGAGGGTAAAGDTRSGSGSSTGAAAAAAGAGTDAGGAAEGSSGSGVGGDDAALAAGMSVLMRSYEAELRNPLRNLLLGDLARALLIQVQHVKVDGEAAMLRLDQILRANELSLSLMAALPAMALSVAAAAGAARLLIPRAPDRKRSAVPSRLAMASLEVALTQLATAQQQQEEKGQEEGQGKAAAAAAASGGVAVEELQGLVEYHLYQVYSEVTSLYASADRTSRFSEWRQLYDDLLRLAAPAAPRERLATHQRMMRTYTVFQR